MGISQEFSSGVGPFQVKVKSTLDRGTVVQSVWCTDTDRLDASLRQTAIYLPHRADVRRKFIKSWAARNAQRLLSGLGAATLLLPMTMPAMGQEGLVDVKTIDGVVSAVIEANGDVVLTMASGGDVRIPADEVTLTEKGDVLVSSSTADAILEIALAGGAGEVGGGALLAGLGGAAVLGGIAGGSGGGETPPAAVETAFVVDGYISGATVFGDANGNGDLDSGEIVITTDSDGAFNKALFDPDVPLVSRGGIDISTGEPFVGTLKAPAGSGVITPITTLVQNLVETTTTSESEEGLSPVEAAAAVSKRLGLSEGSDILNVDPVAEAEAGDTSFLKVNAVIASVINVVTAASDPAKAEGNVDLVLSQLLDDLEEDVDGGLQALAGDGFIEDALKESGALEIDESNLKMVGDALTEVADKIKAISEGELDQIETVQTVVQGQLIEAVEELTLDVFSFQAALDEAAPLRPVLDASSTNSLDFNASDALNITLFGTGQVGSTVSVVIGATEQTSVVDANGDWSVSIADGTFPADGDYTVSVTASKEVEGQTIISAEALDRPEISIDTVAPAAPGVDAVAGDDVITAAEAAGDISVTGTGENGGTVEVFVGGVSQGSGIVSGGVWSVDIESPDASGALEIKAVQTDAAGNAGLEAARDVTVNLDGPSVAITSPAAADLFGAADAGAVSVSGTSANATAGVSVRVTGPGDVEVLAPTAATVQGDGSWSATLDLSGLESDTYSIEATANDGNSTSATTVGVEVEVDAPAAPGIDTVSGDDLVGPGDLAGGDYTVTGTIEEGASVAVTFNGGAAVAADVTGTTWSITRTAGDGTDTISVTATDAAGNTSAAAQTTVDVDLTAPSVAIDTISGDGTVDAGDLTDGNYTLIGTVGAGSTVAVAFDGGDPVSATVVGATWSIDRAAVNGTDSIVVTATDAAGNQGTASTTITIDLPTETPIITVNDDSSGANVLLVDGDLIFYTALEFANFSDSESDENADGNVSGVPTGTEVRLVITPDPVGVPGTTILRTGSTDANGDFVIEIDDQIFIDIDGMTEAGTLAFEVGPEGAPSASLTLDLLVNSAIDDGVSNVFRVGTTAVSPNLDAEGVVANAVSSEVLSSAEQTSGLTVLALDVIADDNDFSVLLAYDGQSATPAELFAFNDFSDIPSLTSRLYVFEDELVVTQINATGDLTDSTSQIQQDPNALFNVYRIPAADVAAAIPVENSQSNLNFGGITSFTISLSDIGASEPLLANEVYIPFDITGSDGQPVWVVYKSDEATGETLETFLVQIDLATQSVNALEIDVGTLVSQQDQGDPNSVLSFDDFKIFGDEFNSGAVETDDQGNFVEASFVSATPPADTSLSGGILFDYGATKLYSVLIGNNNAEDLIIVEGGNTAITGGEEVDDGTLDDNDVIVVGNTTGTETALNIVDNGDETVTVSIATAALLAFTSGEQDQSDIPLPFALQFAGDVFFKGFNYGPVASGEAPTLIDNGSGGAIFDGTLDVTGVDLNRDQTELVTINVQNSDETGPAGDGGDFFAIGFTTDFDESGDPQFDTFQLVQNVDGSGEQLIFLDDSAGLSGQDKIIGFDTSSGADGDRIEINEEASSTQSYAGTNIAKASEGLEILENGIGILVLDTASDPLSEDPDVLAAVTDLSLGLDEDDQLIVLTGDDSGVFVWRIGFDASETAVASDSIARLDGVTASDLADISGSNLSLMISEFG